VEHRLEDVRACIYIIYIYIYVCLRTCIYLYIYIYIYIYIWLKNLNPEGLVKMKNQELKWNSLEDVRTYVYI